MVDNKKQQSIPMNEEGDIIEEDEQEEDDQEYKDNNKDKQNKQKQEIIKLIEDSTSKNDQTKDVSNTSNQSKQQQKKDALATSNEYLKKLGLKFSWDSYDKCIDGKDFKGVHYGQFHDRYRFGDRYYYGYFFQKKSLLDPNLSKCDIDNPNSHFDDHLFILAEEFYSFLENTKNRIANLS